MPPAPPIPGSPPDAARPSRPRFGLVDVAASLGAVAASTGIGFLLSGRRALPDVVMVFVLGVVVVATRFSFAAAILTTFLSVLAYDFLFIPPYYSFTVDDARHVVSFFVMFVVAVVISSLTRRIREQADAARAREARTRELYAERARIAREAEAARLEAEAERLQGLAPQLGLARPAHAARRDHGRRDDAARRPGGDGSGGAARPPLRDQRRGRPAQPPRAEPPRHDAARRRAR